MYAEPFVCDYDATVASGNSTQTFNLITGPGASGSLRKNAVADDGTKPEWMKTSHQTVGKGSSIRDRHLIKFEISSDDGDGNIGTSAPAVAYAVFDIPRNNISGTTVPTVLARMLCGFLRGANSDDTSPDYTTNFAKLMNGEA